MLQYCGSVADVHVDFLELVGLVTFNDTAAVQQCVVRMASTVFVSLHGQ
jgi:hypothetical protein